MIAATLITALPLAGLAQGSIPASPPPAPESPAVQTRLPVVFSGELRTRTERDAPGGTLPPDLYTYLRTRFSARVDTDAGVHLMVQAQDSRVLGAEGHATAATAEEFGLHQAFLELRGKWRTLPVELRAGRQEIAIGNERLVGSAGWGNIGRSFDGARVTLSRPGTSAAGAERWSVTAFAATVEERGRHFGAGSNQSQRDHVLAGVAGSRQLPKGLRGELLAMYDAGGSYRQFTSADRATLYGRIRTQPTRAIAAELEGAWQGGRQRDQFDTAQVHAQTIHAWMGGVRAGRIVTPGRRLSLFVGADLLSGDATPHDATYSAFNTMYASNHLFYGLMDAIAEPSATTRERGLTDVFVNSSMQFNNRISVRAEVHRFAMASGKHRNLGWETDVIAPIRILPTTNLELGVSVFRAGADAPLAGLGSRSTIRDWAFAQLRVAF